MAMIKENIGIVPFDKFTESSICYILDFFYRRFTIVFYKDRQLAGRDFTIIEHL